MPTQPVSKAQLSEKPGGGPQRIITLRAIVLGLIGVILICGLTPYNDNALNNTFLVGNSLPLGVVMLLFLFALLVNGPLTRFAPRWAFSSGEITVAFSMTLVSCALPSSGLMRFFPPELVVPFWLARASADYKQLLSDLNLPDWLFPTFGTSDLSERMNSPIVTGYTGRWTEDAPYPYGAWRTPVFAWGIFFFSLYGAMFCMVSLVRRQWFENERLPFPLAQIYLPLVAQPAPGQWLGGMLRRRAFWVAFGLVFCLHLWNGLFQYYPAYFPRIPVWYSMPDLFSERPWVFVNWKIKDAAVFFTVVGVTYFLTTTVAFSLWSFFILAQFHRIWLGYQTGGDPTNHGQVDQHIGGLLAFLIAILWIGRRHWALILRQAFRGARKGEPRGRYLSYAFSFWGLVGCSSMMVVWLMAAGSTLLPSIIVVLMLLGGFFIVTRIIAETGLVHTQLLMPLNRPWTMLAEYGFRPTIPLRSFFLNGMLNTSLYDYREVMPVFASHGMKVADETIYGGRGADVTERRTGRRLIVLMALALVLGYFVSFGSMLYTEYTYASTRDAQPTTPINPWGADLNVSWQMMAPAVRYESGNYNVTHSPVGHFVFGFSFTGLLSFLRLRYAWWPMHPIGYLMLGTYPSSHLWFSIFWGWLAKVLILRFGGSRLYTSAKPFFLGLIVGESMAAGFWLVMGLGLSTLSLPYRPVRIMPG